MRIALVRPARNVTKAARGAPIVPYMVMHNLERISAAFLQAGPAADMPAAVIASATTPKQLLVSTLEKLAAAVREENIEPPAIVVVDEIVKMRTALVEIAKTVQDCKT